MIPINANLKRGGPKMGLCSSLHMFQDSPKMVDFCDSLQVLLVMKVVSRNFPLPWAYVEIGMKVFF